MKKEVPKTKITTIIIILTALSIGISISYLLVMDEGNIESTNLSDPLYFYDEYVEHYEQIMKEYETSDLYGNKIRKDCGIDEYCIVEEMQKLSRAESKETVLQTFNDLTSVYTQLQMYCHPQGHHLGGFLYGYLGNITEAMSFIDRSCGGSVYHGAIENYVRSEIFFEGTTPSDVDIKEICKQVEGLNIQDRTECNHGVGHALAVVYEYDVLSASKRCEDFDGRWEQKACFEGVFMENTQEIMDSKGGAYDEDDLLYPCNSLEEKYAHPCFYHHATFILHEKESINEAFDVCDQIENSMLAKRCYLGLGRQIGVGFLENMGELHSVCEGGHPEYLTYCYAGAVLTILDDIGTQEGFNACKAFPEKEKSRCYSIMGKWVYQLYPPEQRADQCSQAETDAYYDICISQVADL